ncbi:MAG: hypothetical protein ACM31O_22375 [Bacteroidota bacterium]
MATEAGRWSGAQAPFGKLMARGATQHYRQYAHLSEAVVHVKEQLQRLLDLTEETRRRAAELTESREDAVSRVDKAEYELKQLVLDLGRSLSGIGARVPDVEPSSAAPAPPARLRRT